MPKPYPEEFKNDVLAIARRGDRPVAEVARDFGITVGCLRSWLKKDTGTVPASLERAALVQARARIKVLEQQVEVFKKATAFFSQGVLPK